MINLPKLGERLIWAIFLTGLAVNAATSATKYTFEMFPDGQLYPHYLANPARTTFSAQTQFYESTTIVDTSRRRFNLKIGGLLGILRFQSNNDPNAGMQLSLEGGFHGQFDADQSEDNIGWDGIYGLMFEHRFNEEFAYRIGIHHTSSHVGDELMERTGRSRINYTRQETRLGMTWNVTSHLQLYAEAGHGHDLRNLQLQKPWRYEWGAQYQRPQQFTSRMGWYAAVDFSRYEESDYATNFAMQLGLLWPRTQRDWRIAVEYYDGRNPLGEFFQDKDKYIGIGVWIDI